METNKLIFKNQYIINEISKIDQLAKNYNKNNFYNFIKSYKIDIQKDQDIIQPFTSDWSNIKGGYADFLLRPKTSKESAIILRTCEKCKIPITISAGQTNLTGSATPYGGVVISTNNLISPKTQVNINNQEVTSAIGIPLEVLRNDVIKQSNGTLHYPVDPTSRNDAYVGGTIACNASGFVPGERGSTRFWVKEIGFILTNGYNITIKRGDFISFRGNFILYCDKQEIILPIPRYKRPLIKNASGPYSSKNGEIDFIDLIIGSEGIFGFTSKCKLKLESKPHKYIDLFLRLKNEKQAISMHHFLYSSKHITQNNLTALEYFGYNCQNYMKHKDFLFQNKHEVGVYLQIPILETEEFDVKLNEWARLLMKFNKNINFDNIIILNDSITWKKFFEARHSIPENALSKTKEINGISIITDTIVPPDKLEVYLNTIHLKLKNKQIEYLLFGHLGDCHLHFHLIPSKQQEKECLSIYDFMIDLSSKLGGIYSAEHGTGKRKRADFIKCFGENAEKMILKTKKAIDKNLILNQGNVIKIT